ncbi:MAG: ornithine cyclodeaminase family protein [Actinobacteria bacterium]|nr:ornithine cyclodeaminase family protein [Actinomycetota bacterium]
MSLPYVNEESLNELLSMEAAIDALEEAVRLPLPEAPERHLHQSAFGEFLLMPAWGGQGSGVKLVAIRADNPPRGLPYIQGVFVMFAADDSRPLGVVDGAALTALRTAAVSGLAARHLAREDAVRLTMIGAGRQAHAHLDAMLAVRPLESVAVVSHRDHARAEALCDRAGDLGLAAEVTDLAAVGSADLVCLCTTSSTPVLDGRALPAGVHVTAMGSYRPDLRELDNESLRRSSVFVEVRDAALAEAGDLIQAIDEGAWSADRISGDLADVVAGRAGRKSAAELTVFKSVGVAWEDLVVAQAALERAAAASSGPGNRE